MNLLLAGILLLTGWVGGFSQTLPSSMRKMELDPLVIYFHPRDETFAEKLAGTAAGSLERISQFLDLEIEGSITILIAENEKEFRRLTGGQIPEWGAAAAFPNQSVICLIGDRALPDNRMQEITAHELSHVLLARLLNGREIDRWIDEGFAEVMSRSGGLSTQLILFRAFSFGGVIDLEAINSVLSFQRDKAGLAYAESVSAVEYLMEQYGDRVIPDLAGALASGAEPDSAFMQAAGLDFSAFQENWAAEMRVRYRWGFLLEFRLLLSILMVIAFFSAVIAAYRRAKKKRMEWDEEESDEEI